MRNAFVGLGLTLCLIAILPVVALVLGVSAGELINAVSDTEVLSAIGLSLGCAVVAVALGTILGVPAAYLIARRAVPGVRWLQAVFDLPLVIPHPIVGIGLLLALSRSSLLGGALDTGLGLRVASAVPGIIIAMTVVSCPLIIRAAVAGFAAVPVRYENTAHVLGATPVRAFFRVTFPMAQRSVRAGILMAWARAISEFGSIAVLAYYPKTAPVLIWDRFTSGGLNAALGPSLLLLAVCGVAFLAWQWLEGESKPELRG